MKILIYSDPHFCKSTSILTNIAGYKYSARLDSLINSYKWMYEQARLYEVSEIYNLGDLLDATNIGSMEISALSDALSYNTTHIPEYHLVGNHDKDSDNLNSIAVLGASDHITIIDKPTIISSSIYAVPYTEDYESLNLNEVAKEMINNRIMLSHLSYNGVMIGYRELSGLSQSLVCGLFKHVFNGHIHTASRITDSKVINVGSLVGYGFNDDYSVSLPNIIIYNTDTNSVISRIVNPEACLFYKSHIKYASEVLQLFDKLVDYPNPKCISLEVPFSIRSDVEGIIESYKSRLNLIQYRVRGLVTSETKIKDINESQSVSETDIVLNNGFKSGIDALVSYINKFPDSELPQSKDKFEEFFKEYLSEEVAE